MAQHDELIALVVAYGEARQQAGALEERIAHVARCLTTLQTEAPVDPVMPKLAAFQAMVRRHAETLTTTRPEPNTTPLEPPRWKRGDKQRIFLGVLQRGGGKATSEDLRREFAAVGIPDDAVHLVAQGLRTAGKLKPLTERGVYELSRMNGSEP